jgi:RNA polymerase sigma-70 factor (ECF subfamily)
MAEARAGATDDESALVALLQAGDERAFETLVRENSARLLSVSRRILRNDEEARDALQEAFILAFRSIDRFRSEARLGTWLHRILVNACLMRLRTRKRLAEESIEDRLPRFEAAGHAAVRPRDWSASAEDLVATRETRVFVRQAIDRLPEVHRLVLILRDIEELDTREAAALLEISENACKVRLHRARQALRTELAVRFGEITR